MEFYIKQLKSLFLADKPQSDIPFNDLFIHQAKDAAKSDPFLSNLLLALKIFSELVDRGSEYPARQYYLGIYEINEEKKSITLDFSCNINSVSVDDSFTTILYIKNQEISPEDIWNNFKNVILGEIDKTKLTDKKKESAKKTITEELGFKETPEDIQKWDAANEDVYELLQKSQNLLATPHKIGNLISNTFFLKAFTYLVHSVVSGEHMMFDDYSQQLYAIEKKCQPNTSSSTLPTDSDIFQVFADTLGQISKMLIDFRFFNTLIDAQIDKSPANVLYGEKKSGKDQGEFYFKDNIVEYLSFDPNPASFFEVLAALFYEILEMSKIDHNFVFTRDNFAQLLKLDEYLNDDNYGILKIFGKSLCKNLCLR